MRKLKQLETSRLILRMFEEKDMEAIWEIFKDEKVNTYLPWFPLQTLAEAKTFFHQNILGNDDYRYAICLKEENVPIGYVTVSMQESHDFGYGLLEKYWRQGIVSEAARAVMEHVKNEGLSFLTATHDINNEHSGYVMQSLGMKYQYTYEELWQPKNKIVHFRMYQLNFDESDFVFKDYWEKSKVRYIEKELLQVNK
ncbi:MAG: GNAT family N-acetyltransferase [Erysipelotrichaceae bacterium]|nr:GNAT family N-acetyltransferase [Erysipelotrichaceae bacterium]